MRYTRRLERGLHEDASLAQLHKNMGDYLYRGAQYDDALDAYTRAIKLRHCSGDALVCPTYSRMFGPSTSSIAMYGVRTARPSRA